MIDPFVTADGRRLVPYDNAEQYFAAHPGALELLGAIAGEIRLPKGDRLEVQFDLGRPLGAASLVEVKPIGIDEETVFALRKGRDKPSHVIVLESEPPQISTFVVVGRPDRNLPEGDYRLMTAYVGVIAPREPWDKKTHSQHVTDDEALAFWSSHAIVWDPASMGETFVSTWRKVLAS